MRKRFGRMRRKLVLRQLQWNRDLRRRRDPKPVWHWLRAQDVHKSWRRMRKRFGRMRSHTLLWRLPEWSRLRSLGSLESMRFGLHGEDLHEPRRRMRQRLRRLRRHDLLRQLPQWSNLLGKSVHLRAEVLRTARRELRQRQQWLWRDDLLRELPERPDVLGKPMQLYTQDLRTARRELRQCEQRLWRNALLWQLLVATGLQLESMWRLCRAGRLRQRRKQRPLLRAPTDLALRLHSLVGHLGQPGLPERQVGHLRAQPPKLQRLLRLRDVGLLLSPSYSMSTEKLTALSRSNPRLL